MEGVVSGGKQRVWEKMGPEERVIKRGEVMRENYGRRGRGMKRMGFSGC